MKAYHQKIEFGAGLFLKTIHFFPLFCILCMHPFFTFEAVYFGIHWKL